MTIEHGNVFIFKAQADDDSSMLYAKLMEDAGFLPIIIPVLEFQFCNLEFLKEQLQRPHDYSGIIFTSPRTVKAVVKSIGTMRNLAEEWKKLPMFVVGSATKNILKTDLGLDGECGMIEDAAGLAEIIIKRIFDHPLLFPCSNIRRDTLPVLLKERGVPFMEINVYSTRPNALLEDILQNVTGDGARFPEYMVFFSPSGVNSALPILLKWNAPLDDIKIIAIGKTTASALTERNVEVSLCSQKPSPQHLVDTLLGGV